MQKYLQHMKFGTGFIISMLIFFSCSSPEKLVNRAIKKNPEVLNKFIDTAFIEGETQIKLLPYVPKPNIVDKLIESREKRQDRRLENREDRRANRTKRVKARQEASVKIRESKDFRRTLNTSLRADKRVSINSRNNERKEGNTEARQKGRTNRRWASVFLFSIVFFIFGVVGGYQLSNRLNGKDL